jgi:subtilisin family serine protease
VSYLRQQQADFLSRASVALGRPVNPLLSFQYGVNGLSLKLTGDEVNKIRDLPGVALVDRVMLTELNTDAGPAWIGAPTIWDGSNVFGGVGTFGEGVVLGILDSGINQDHPSFAEVGPIDGFRAHQPTGFGQFHR